MRDAADTALRRAWWSVASFPLAFVGAFVVGEGLFAVFDDGVGGTPPWAVAAAAIPALLVFCIPAFLAIRFGRRAMELGRPQGRTPARLALALAAAFVAINLLAGVAQLIVG